MTLSIQRLGILTGGGDCPGLNMEVLDRLHTTMGFLRVFGSVDAPAGAQSMTDW